MYAVCPAGEIMPPTREEQFAIVMRFCLDQYDHVWDLIDLEMLEVELNEEFAPLGDQEM